MRARVLGLLVAAVVLSGPAYAAGGTAAPAPAIPNDAPNFDGSRPRLEGDVVPAGSSTDGRSAEQIAKDEQLKVRPASVPALGSGKEIEPPKPSEWLKSDHLLSGVKGAVIGLLVGSLWGLTGLGIGVLVGGLIGYALSRLTP